MKPETCPRCEDFADDARKVLNEKCAPDERHCSCVPHLRAEVARLTADNTILSNANISLLERVEKAEREVTFGAHLVEMHPTARGKAQARLAEVEQERDKARATAEELRLTLAAEQGRAEGAPSKQWRNDGGEWLCDWPPTETPYGVIRWASVRGDPVDGYVLMGKIRAGEVPAYADLPGFETTPTGEEAWLFLTARAAMQAADAATATHP